MENGECAAMVTLLLPGPDDILVVRGRGTAQHDQMMDDGTGALLVTRML